MIGGAASLLLALGLGSAALPVADFDIPFFLANPQVHEEMLRRCHNDERLAMTLECENAERAGARRIGRPLPRNFGKDFGKIPSTKQPPLPKGKERGS